MPPAPKDFSEVYDALQKLLRPYQPRLVTRIDKPGHLYLDAPTDGPNGQPLYFGGVRTGTSSVGFHLMPVYVNPALLERISPELRKRLQGKSCFNFTRAEYTLFRELGALVQAGFDDYASTGRLGYEMPGPRLLHTPGSPEIVRRRLERLTPGTPARWGRLDAPRMLAHVADQLRIGLGDLAGGPAEAASGVPHALIGPVIWWLPWPRHVKGPGRSFVTPPGDWAADRARLADLMTRFAGRPLDATWSPHPTFGRLTGRDWSRLTWRHLDHHLTQFGV